MFSLISHVLFIVERQMLYQNDPPEVGRLLRVSTAVRNTAVTSYIGISKGASNNTAKSDVIVWNTVIMSRK